MTQQKKNGGGAVVQCGDAQKKMFVIPRVAVSTTTQKTEQHINRLARIAVTKLRSSETGVVHRSSTDPAAADDARLILPS